MNTCGQCLYYLAGVSGIDAGPCFGLPPTPMLLPMAAPAQAGRLAVPGAAPRIEAQLQGIRVMVQDGDRACSLFRPVEVH